MYEIELTKQAVKDALLIENAKLKPKLKDLIQILRTDPYATPPRLEKLLGLENTYSRRINKKHRLVYQILPSSESPQNALGETSNGKIKIIRMWSHYE